MSGDLESIRRYFNELVEWGLLVRIKAETESEGAPWWVIRRLVSFSESCGLQLSLKIGGCEAKTDLEKARDLGIRDFVAPMIESEFAASKFFSSVGTVFSGEVLPATRILIESQQGLSSLPGIISQAGKNDVDSLNFGRSDYARSLGVANPTGVDRSVDSRDVIGAAREVIMAARSLKVESIVGGTFTGESFRKLAELDFPPSLFETRRLVCDFSVAENLGESVIRKILFGEMMLERYFSLEANRASKKLAGRVVEVSKRIDTPFVEY